MHNTLKYFRDKDLNSLLSDMETFMKNESVTGKSISLAKDSNGITALLGYTPGKADHQTFYFVTKPICKASESDDTIQKAINKAADEVGRFICQAGIVEDGDLSVVFLTA